MSTVVFVESNTTGSGKLLLQKTIEQGFTAVFITARPQKYRFLDELLVSPVVLDTSNVDRLSQYLSTVANIQAILSSSEYFVETASKLAQRFGLVGNDPAAIACCRDKKKLATSLQAAGVACPNTKTISSLTEIETVISEFTAPFVVKPRAGSGSCLVKLCRTQAEGAAQAKAILETDQAVLVQSYAEGAEYSVETLTLRGKTTLIGITQKYLGKEPHFVEIGHDFPADLTHAEHSGIQQTVETALSAVGFAFGAAHTELRLSPAGATIIEINPRLAGGMLPTVIQFAYGLDLLDVLLEMHLGRSPAVVPKQQKYAAIRFLLPPEEITLKEVKGIEQLAQQPEVVDYQQIKKAGDRVGGKHDFSDRVAYLITAADTRQSAVNAANAALATLQAVGDRIAENHIAETKEEHREDSPLVKTGRLKKTLSPSLRKLVFPALDDAQLAADLARLTTLDEAHLIMLVEQGIIPAQTAAALLGQIQALQKDHSVLASLEAPRGLYLLYESVLVDRLGTDVAGVLQTARSRNDMNATIFKLSVRDGWRDIFHALWNLRNTLLSRLSTEIDTVFPIYSQYQTALPGTLAHYLLAIEDSLSRCSQELASLLSSINQSPLGAGGGGGTSWRIDPFRLADLLGFSSLHTNSLDAVSSRDLGIRYLSALNNITVTFSRVAQDIQLWTTQEFGLVQLPDTLSGGSSMMPQKKNPYLLEWIKSKAFVPMGALTKLTMAIAKTPFSNSYEVSASAQSSLLEPTQACLGATEILQAIIEQMQVDADACRRRVTEGLTFSTAIADECVRNQGMSFRSAHHQVGETIRHAIDNQQSPLSALEETFPNSLTGSPLSLISSIEYGGGPGRQSSETSILKARQRLTIDASLYRATTHRWHSADRLRQTAVNDLLKKESAL